MKRPSNSLAARPAHCRAAFTLVEMLVVISIIGILAGLTIPAVMIATGHAKDATIAMQMTELERACQAYKEKFGEYPPDFSGIDRGDAVGVAARAAVMRHLAIAFPQYRPANWSAFQNDVRNYWQLDVNNLTPAGALTFFLGGEPDWLIDTSGDPNTLSLFDMSKVLREKPVKGFRGFSADPTNPFLRAAVSPSRIGPFYDFDLKCLKCSEAAGGNFVGQIAVWPSSGCNKSKDHPIVYFRAADGSYFSEGATPATTVKSCDVGNVTVYPAMDTTLSQPAAAPPVITWVNPSSVQILSAGRDASYSQLTAEWLPMPPFATGSNCLAYPTGENYGPNTYDDITNFSGGKLESKIP